jgi:hypothetical protein
MKYSDSSSTVIEEISSLTIFLQHHLINVSLAYKELLIEKTVFFSLVSNTPLSLWLPFSILLVE